MRLTRSSKDIVAAFNAAAQTYDAATPVQRDVARELVAARAAIAPVARQKYSISAAAPVM